MSNSELSPIERFLAKASERLQRSNQPIFVVRRPKLCGARARSSGKPCRRKARANGKCRNHGGLSTGPRTVEGKRKALGNLKQFRSSEKG